MLYNHYNYPDNYLHRLSAITDCRFENNNAIGIRSIETDATISGSLFSENERTAVVWQSGGLEVENSIFRDNGGDGLSLIDSQELSLLLENSISIKNEGVGVALVAKNATLKNCTIAGNAGGGISCYYPGEVTVTNSILWNQGTGNNEITGSSCSL